MMAFLIAPVVVSAQPSFTEVAEFSIPDAGQGVGVDARFFYAVDDTAISKYEKKTGTLVKRWTQDKGGPLIHLDGAMVRDGKIYAAHSNYPAWPMTSSRMISTISRMDRPASSPVTVTTDSSRGRPASSASWYSLAMNTSVSVL